MPARKGLCLFLATRLSSFSYCQTVLQQATGHVWWTGMVFCWLSSIADLYIKLHKCCCQRQVMVLIFDLVCLSSVFGGIDFVHLIFSKDQFFCFSKTWFGSGGVDAWTCRSFPLQPVHSPWSHYFLALEDIMADLSTNEEKLLGNLVREKYGLELVVQFRNLARLAGKHWKPLRIWFVLSRPVPICCQAWGEQYLAKTVSTFCKIL